MEELNFNKKIKMFFSSSAFSSVDWHFWYGGRCNFYPTELRSIHYRYRKKRRLQILVPGTGIAHLPHIQMFPFCAQISDARTV